MGTKALSVAMVSILPAMIAGMTVQPYQVGQLELVGPDHLWSYLEGNGQPSVPADAWTQPDYDDSGWRTGYAGFGYGDGDDRTVLQDMQGGYLTLYIRAQFQNPQVAPDRRLELVIDYDDGFIAYLNGQEVARRGMPSGPATYQTVAASHEAGTPEVIQLGSARELLRPGTNVLAIEGHNASLTSGDFSLNPTLRLATGLLRNGSVWISQAKTVDVLATTQTKAHEVTLDGKAMTAQADGNTWLGPAELTRGMNRIWATAFDQAGRVLEQGALEVIYLSDTDRVDGIVDTNSVWSKVVWIDGHVQIAPQAVVSIEPGTWVLLGDQARLTIYGQLLASGTGRDPIHLTRIAEGISWRQILFARALPSRLNYCIIEYGGTGGSHTDYYQPGPRSYHEAVVVLAGHLDMYGCTVRYLPGDGPDAQADAIAIISDDPNLPGRASATIKACRFIDIGQGIHTRYSQVLVEGCYFRGKRGDNDDIDLYGESDPAPVIRSNVFDLPVHDDRINPTLCSAVIEGNVIMGSDDHGIVLRDRGWPLVVNNLIVNCSNGAVAVENSCDALLVNNTIVNCGRGIRLFDLGRWDPPYRLNPGGGTATVINCIIWDCPEPITLADSSNTTIPDRGSHVTVRYCDIQGGLDGVSVSGEYSSVKWEEGNLDLDPVFLDPDQSDYRLAPGSPLIDVGTTYNAPATDLDGFARPCGPAVDIGAYEFGQCPTE